MKKKKQPPIGLQMHCGRHMRKIKSPTHCVVCGNEIESGNSYCRCCYAFEIAQRHMEFHTIHTLIDDINIDAIKHLII